MDDKKIAEVIKRFVELSEAYVYVKSTDNTQKTLDILSNKLADIIRDTPQAVIPTLALSMYLKDLMMNDTDSPEEAILLMDKVADGMVEYLKKAVPLRVEEVKEFNEKSESILSEVGIILNRENDNESEV